MSVTGENVSTLSLSDFSNPCSDFFSFFQIQQLAINLATFLCVIGDFYNPHDE